MGYKFGKFLDPNFAKLNRLETIATPNPPLQGKL
jgi:hypothetical protein